VCAIGVAASSEFSPSSCHIGGISFIFLF